MLSKEDQIIKKIKSDLLNKGYPEDRIKQEYSFFVGNSSKRADLVVLDYSQNPFVIVETKYKIIYEVAIEQLKTYLKATGAKYGVVTDGSESIILTQLKKEPFFVSISNLPLFNEKIDQINKKQLKPIPLGSNIFRESLNIIQTEPISSNQQFQELLKIIIAKVYDESFSNTVNFQLIFSNNEIDEIKTVYEIEKLIALALKKYNLSYFNKKSLLREKAVVEIVSLFQQYSFKNKKSNITNLLSDTSSKLLRGLRGEHFTPDLVVSLVLDLIKIKKNSLVLDSNAGTGNFLIETHKKYKAKNLYGFETNDSLIKLAKTNFVLSGLNPDRINSGCMDEEKKYDIVICNLSMYVGSLSQEKKEIEVLFLEKCLKLLKDGGQMVIVLPEKLLLEEKYAELRRLITKQTRIRAIIRLPTYLFKNYPIIGANLVILGKEKTTENTESFFANLEKDTVFYEKKLTSTKEIIKKKYFAFLKNKKAFSLDPLIYSTKIFEAKRLDIFSNNPSFEKLKRKILKNAEKVVKLGEICEIKRGVSFSPSEFLDEGTPYIRIQDLVNGKIKPKIFVSPEKITPGLRVKEKDVLISVKGTIGKVALATKADAWSIVSSGIYTLTVNDKEINERYLLEVLKSTFVKEQLKRITKGLIIPFISIEDLKKIEIPIVSFEKQKELFSKIEEINLQMGSLEKEKSKLLKESEDLLKFLSSDVDEH